MQLALCYLKPDVVVLGRGDKALELLVRHGFVVRDFHILGMNRQIYRLAYAEGFDALHDAWELNYRFACIGPWVALLLSCDDGVEDAQAHLKTMQGRAIPGAPAGSLRSALGHANRIFNCLHVPDTAQSAASQLEQLFSVKAPGRVSCAITGEEIAAELNAHAYVPMLSSCRAFREAIWRRALHRASRVAPFTAGKVGTIEPAAPTSSAVADVINVLELSKTEAQLLSALLVNADIGANRMLKVANIASALERNFIYLSEWDQAQLYGYFAYPTLE